MLNSQLSYLKKCNKIVLSAGHGGVDPGAVNGQYRESSQVRTICDIIAKNLQNKGIQIEVFPDWIVANKNDSDGVLNAQINYLNQNYPAWNPNNDDNIWAIQIHRDSGNVDIEEGSNRCGVYYYADDSDSQAVGDNLRDTLRREGANSNSWSRPHTSRGFPLGWMQLTYPLTHLIELGFMQGRNDDAWIQELARRATIAIYEVFTDYKYQDNPPTLSMPTLKDKFYEVIKNDTFLDENTKNYLIQATNNEDAGYLLTFGGIEPRKQNKELEKEIANLQANPKVVFQDNQTAVNIEVIKLKSQLELAQKQLELATNANNHTDLLDSLQQEQKTNIELENENRYLQTQLENWQKNPLYNLMVQLKKSYPVVDEATQKIAVLLQSNDILGLLEKAHKGLQYEQQIYEKNKEYLEIKDLAPDTNPNLVATVNNFKPFIVRLVANLATSISTYFLIKYGINLNVGDANISQLADFLISIMIGLVTHFSMFSWQNKKEKKQ